MSAPTMATAPHASLERFGPASDIYELIVAPADSFVVDVENGRRIDQFTREMAALGFRATRYRRPDNAVIVRFAR